MDIIGVIMVLALIYWVFGSKKSSAATDKTTHELIDQMMHGMPENPAMMLFIIGQNKSRKEQEHLLDYYRQCVNAVGNAPSAPLRWERSTEIFHLDPCRVEFDYCDAEGKDTRREVSVYSYECERGEPVRISGMCKLRGEKRTFRIERMDKVILLDTGEVFEDGEEFIEAVSAQGKAAA